MVEEMRRALFRHFAETGRPPDLTREELALLAERRAVVLGADGALEFANPFAVGPTEHVVTTGAGVRYAICIWDALGILALLGDGRIDANGLELVVRDGELEPTDTVVHFLVPAAQWYDDLRFT